MSGTAESHDAAKHAEPASVGKIIKWATLGALGAFGTVMLVSSGMVTGVRITCGVMAAGAGFVTAALLCANFGEEGEDAPSSADSTPL